MNLVSLIVSLVVLLTLPSAFVGFKTAKIMKSDMPKKEKTYLILKAQLIGGLLAFAIYLPTITLSGLLDRTSNLVDKMPLPLLLRAVLFALILISPLFLSVFTMLLTSLTVSSKVLGKNPREVLPKRTAGVLVILVAVIAPIIGFSLLWWALMLYLPHSLTSKWWFDFVMYALLILTLFVLYPEVRVRIGQREELDPELKAELLEFCREQGVKVRDIVVKGSEKTANAMVTGILPGRRYIILTPGLLKNFEKDEIKAVIAHELGHIKERHLWISATLSIGWFAFWGLLIYSIYKLDKNLLNSGSAFAAIFIGSVLMWDHIITPKVTIQNEFKADEFAAKTAGVEATIRALEKLSKMSP
ncbi:M48 family metalloprotease, partial [Thermococcus sp.]